MPWQDNFIIKGFVSRHYTLLTLSGHEIFLELRVAESEQIQLDSYIYFSKRGSLNLQGIKILYVKHIPFEKFFRYIQKVRYVEYISGIYYVCIVGSKNQNMFELGKDFHKLLTGEVKLLPANTHEFAEIRKCYAEKLRRKKEKLPRENAAEIEHNRNSEERLADLFRPVLTKIWVAFIILIFWRERNSGE